MMPSDNAILNAHKSSVLEARFLDLWTSLHGPELEQEFRFFPSRRWRADFAHVDSRTLIEIEGGIWSRGRHITPKGFQADAEKYLTATLNGWSVLRLTHAQLTKETILSIIGYVRRRVSE